VKEDVLRLPQVQSAAQQGVHLRVLLQPGLEDPGNYLRENLGNKKLTLTTARPSLEDVFVASTRNGKLSNGSRR